MHTKKCSTCKKDLDLSCFSKKSSNKLQSKCKDCQNIYSRNHYKQNSELHKKRSIKKKQDTKQWYQEFKSTLKCQMCEETHPACLQFHHTDPSKKEANPAKLICENRKSKFLEEIKKCIVLCANCHAKHHYDERQK